MAVTAWLISKSVGLDTVTINLGSSYDSEDIPEDDKKNSYNYNDTIWFQTLWEYEGPFYYYWTIPNYVTDTIFSSDGTLSKTLSIAQSGSLITIEATVVIYCTEKIIERKREREINEDGTYSKWSNWQNISEIDYQEKIGSATVSIPIYTHPGGFTGFSNISTGDIIQIGYDEKDSKGNLLKEGLSAKRVNEWCQHCNKYLSWKNQTASTTADACKVNPNDFITAAWYNKCAETCGISTRVSNDHTQSNSLITAECIKALGTAISS